MSSPLLSLLLERIRGRGPMTVAEYLGLALYHPEFGYYASADQRSGREGDFYTSVDLGPVFGELLAVQFAEMWRVTRGQAAAPAVPAGGAEWTGRSASSAGSGASAPSEGDEGFDLVEAAAGNGRLSRDVLDWAASHDREFYEIIRLHLVEASARARARHPDVLGRHAGILAGSPAALPAGVRGVIFANELLDALPPHLVAMRESGLREVYVDAADGRLAAREGPPSSPRLAAYLEAAGARLEPGWFAEVNLAAVDWVAVAADRLDRGFLVLIDYGHEAVELFSAARATGTLTAYRRHASEARGEGPAWLSEPGSRDITSHVDFTSVRRAAANGGLQPLGQLDQSRFLLNVATRLVARDATWPPGRRQRLALKTLMLPGGLGSTHQVLIFGKGVGCPALCGFPADSGAHRSAVFPGPDPV